MTDKVQRSGDITMYENYSRQSLPTKEYRELLGSALCVFSSNNGFIIENIINTDDLYNWYDLIDKESGKLEKSIADTISKKTGNKEIEKLFLEIVDMRNRIIHGFRITSKQGQQVLATKTLKKNGNIQFEITTEYLMDFIKKNEKLSDLLHEYRGY